MALHLQQQILDAVTALITGASVALNLDHVEPDPIDPVRKGIERLVRIEEGENGDDVLPGSIRSLQQRSFELVIHCLERRTTPAAARAFGLEVEKLVSTGNPTLRGLCKGGWALTNSRQSISGEGEELVVDRLLTYRFDYFVLKTTPDVVA
jgi:hypothetical protein